jgi:hypothetical protein
MNSLMNDWTVYYHEAVASGLNHEEAVGQANRLLRHHEREPERLGSEIHYGDGAGFWSESVS